MRSVLGIDAAWTDRYPSGVALVVERRGTWELITAASSYEEFLAIKSGHSSNVTTPSLLPNISALLALSACLIEGCVDLIAIDMPLSLTPIVGRRASDDAISKAYGSRKCAAHSPSAFRPGKISDDLTRICAGLGYTLRTTTIVTPGLIEVYPHPALVELARAKERLMYKRSKIATYWPGANRHERIAKLRSEWIRIVAILNDEIRGVSEQLQVPNADSPVRAMKAFEDKLDAVVCAWVGVCALTGCAVPFGDRDSGIWVPKHRA